MVQLIGLLFTRSPSSAALWEAKGRDYESQGHLARAEWAFKRALFLGMESSTAYYHLARVQDLRGRLEDAKLNYVRSLELKPDFYLCRIKFFEMCRLEYWRARPGLLEQVERQLEKQEAAPELHFRRLHLLVSDGLFQQMRFEVARQDYDDLDHSVFERLCSAKTSMRGTRRARDKYERNLNRTRKLFDVLEQELEEFTRFTEGAILQRAKLTLRSGRQLELDGLRDGDDLIGHHLEVISGGKLSFLGLERVKRIEFGLHSEFIETRLELRDGSKRHVVMPSIYYGSDQSTHTELQHGGYTIFKDVYRGIQMGVGRRVLKGRGGPEDAWVAVGIHEIRAIEFP